MGAGKFLEAGHLFTSFTLLDGH